MKDTVEAMVKGGLKRIDIQLPAGLRLGGVEGTLDSLTPPREELPAERLVRAERDLARYMGILFKPVEVSLCIGFRTDSLAKVARGVWEESRTGGRVLAFGRGKKKTNFGSKSFASGDDAMAFRQAVMDSDCTHLVVVAPRAQHLRVVADIAEEVGNNICIILLNANLRGMVLGEADELHTRFAQEYRVGYHLRFAGRDGLIFRSYTEGGGTTPWVLARRRLEATADGEDYFSRQVMECESRELTAAEIANALR